LSNYTTRTALIISAVSEFFGKQIQQLIYESRDTAAGSWTSHPLQNDVKAQLRSCIYQQ